MYVPGRMTPSNMQRFTANSIEAVSATIRVPNAASIQIGVIYRSPSVPQTTLTTVQSRLLTHLSMFSVRSHLTSKRLAVLYFP